MENRSYISEISNSYLNITKFTDDDISQISQISENQDLKISQNIRIMNILFSGLHNLSQQNFQEAIKIFKNGINFFTENSENIKNSNYNISLMYTNIALSFFYLQNLKKSEQNLNKASSFLDINKNIKKEHFRILYLKILSNYLIIYIKNKNFENVQQIINLIKEFITNEKKNSKRANYITQLIYMLFKQDSLLKKKIFENFENLSDNSKGINLLIKAFMAEFLDENNIGALFFDALEFYKAREDPMMCLVILRHLIFLYRNDMEKYETLKSYYDDIINSEDIDKEQIENLFLDFNEKIDVVKKLCFVLKDIEKKNKRFCEENERNCDVKFMKFVIKLNLRKSFVNGEKVVKEGNLGMNQIKKYKESLSFIEKTLELLDSENSQAMVNMLSSHKYVKTSLEKLKQSINVIIKTFYIILFKSTFQKILIKAENSKTNQKIHNSEPPKLNPLKFVQQNIKFSMVDSLIKNKKQLKTAKNHKIRSVISETARKTVQKGALLTKLNFTSRGYLKKYVKIINNNTLRWAKKEKYLKNINNCHSYDLNDIKGIVYGKVTKTFTKRNKNKKLYPWLCFSIIFKKRPLDIYCTEEQINNWYIGLSELVKLFNSKAVVLSKGKFLWRKFGFLMKYAAVMSLSEKKRKGLKKGLSFCKAILLYDKLRNG